MIVDTETINATLSQASALRDIAKAIAGLALAVTGLATPIWLMLLFKDMGRGSDVASKMKDKQ